eukprot:15459984-Alexandrium_andersonii.AAC.1
MRNRSRERCARLAGMLPFPNTYGPGERAAKAWLPRSATGNGSVPAYAMTLARADGGCFPGPTPQPPAQDRNIDQAFEVALDWPTG